MLGTAPGLPPYEPARCKIYGFWRGGLVATHHAKRVAYVTKVSYFCLRGFALVR